MAVIPAVPQIGKRRTCSIQIISDCDVWNVVFPSEMFRKEREKIRIGENQFDGQGMRLKIRAQELTVDGKVSFGSLSPLRYGIMGPFTMVPFLECRHSVWSMRHLVNGTIHVNDQGFCFENARGYWEGAACKAMYRFCKKGNPIFYFETDKASFEYEYD